MSHLMLVLGHCTTLAPLWSMMLASSSEQLEQSSKIVCKMIQDAGIVLFRQICTPCLIKIDFFSTGELCFIFVALHLSATYSFWNTFSTYHVLVATYRNMLGITLIDCDHFESISSVENMKKLPSW